MSTYSSGPQPGDFVEVTVEYSIRARIVVQITGEVDDTDNMDYIGDEGKRITDHLEREAGVDEAIMDEWKKVD